MQQEAITLTFGVKGGCYPSEGFVCASVIRIADAVDRLLILFMHTQVLKR